MHFVELTEPPALRLLGTVEVVVDGSARPVAGARRTALLAALALHVGEVVSVHRLMDVVWNGEAPATALNTLQRHVSFLRREYRLGERIVARAGGYVMELGGATTDVRVAERLIGRARRAADPYVAADLLRTALTLWRGPALADLADLPSFDAQARHLDELRWTARRLLTEARLAVGEHLVALPELAVLAARFPLDEDLHRQLMLALYRSGRQAEALAVYHDLRIRLRGELGVDPTPRVGDLHLAILRHDPTLLVLGRPPVAGGRAIESASRRRRRRRLERRS
ncbi:AfsR/SARP family transcriptional regulator [Phytohabitans flavus]|uniref:OmpR/PhoB-type domain-containing protein n=1 Tax=Phytohabitans flavus TaxID=1076124 RepID=A0A6F8XVW4_9ACTN|nr:AfsR/SARP family transcriptional regulator [Phytohabitans flavus]BCB77960.1 hypothetical protein Pflav_043700 [Phytohabitans flavus]